MKLEEIFELKPEGEDAFVKMTTEDFVTKTKDLLKLIDKEYAMSWRVRWLEESEYDLAPCDGCIGSNCFIKDGKKINCAQNKSEGECYERVFDDEQFAAQVENIMFDANSDFYSLIQARVEGFNSNISH